MTFIAAVIAKNGVALIADSLVTTEQPILPYEKFISYTQDQKKDKAGKPLLDSDQMVELFEFTPQFTKDYEEKLFQLTPFIGIMTTGVAYINGHNIKDLIELFKKQLKDWKRKVPFQRRLEQFSQFLNEQVRTHLIKYSVQIGNCTFIVVNYDKDKRETSICKVIINACDGEHLDDEHYNYIKMCPEPVWAKVVCDGQNKISETVLYGLGRTFFDHFPDIVNDIIKRLNLPEGTVPGNFIKDLMKDKYYSELVYSDLKLNNLTELSLQQAVDLASLLMRLEVDFQKYTRNMPTVGGVIKLAYIGDDGFHFLLGDKVEPPKHIHL